MSPRGRRPAGEDTRGAILETARAQFAEHGYDRTSLRGIARGAEVDPRLVHHYFEGGKAELFAEVMHAPVNPAAFIADVVAGPPEDIGRQLVRTFLGVWDDPDNQSALLALARSGLTNEGITDQLRGFVEQGLLGQIMQAHPVTAGLPLRERRRRAGVIGVQMLGLIISRYVVELPGVADAPAATLVDRIGPIIQAQLES